MRGICAGIAMILLFGLAAAADGLMDLLGPNGFLLASLATCGVAGILIQISNLPDRRD